MLFSFFTPQSKRYPWRWMFGLGMSLFVLCIGIVSTSIHQKASAYDFADSNKTYRAIITDVPQEKVHHIALKLHLPECNKNIICNIQSSILSKRLRCGDEILFSGKIQAIKNLGNPNEFDYASYMSNCGFSGTIYIRANQWDTTGESHFSLKILALRCRQHIIEFYKSFNLEDREFAILSALTLGYKNSLSDDLQQSFRATGTAHILAVSGLHVAIIFAVISFLFSAFEQDKKGFLIKQLFIILFLWVYAFVTGLSPSVIRACIILSLFCVSSLFRRKTFSFNSISFAAFVMLLINPLSLFDIGFQYSFVAVLSILFLHPYAKRIYSPQNKIARSVWELFSISCIAQLGTFLLSLYYFGTFPSYFFITNLFVIPLVGVILYTSIILLVLSLFVLLFPEIGPILYFIPVHILHYSTWLMIHIISFFEKLPFAYFQGMKINLPSLFLLFFVLFCFITAFIERKSGRLKLALSGILFFIVIHIPNKINAKDELIIYNRPKIMDIKWNIGKEKFSIDSLVDYRFVDLRGKHFLALKKESWKTKVIHDKFIIDYLYLSGNNIKSVYPLNKIFIINNIILDGSLSDKRRRKISNESATLQIPCYDMKTSGAFSIKF